MNRTFPLAAAIGASALALACAPAAHTWAQTAFGPTVRNPFFPPSFDDEQPALPLVADGYCVVTLRDQQQWLAGNRDVGGEFDGREYRFANLRARAIFAAAPEKYAPVLGGDCIVTFADTGQRVPGRIQHGVVRGGRLYFMADQRRLGDFTADPARYVDADLADGGRCPVTLHDQHRSVAGIPATVATYGGRRYWFASARQRTEFLADPRRYAPEVAGHRSSGLGATASAPRGSEEQAPAPRPDDEDGPDATLAAQPLMGGYCPVTIRQTGSWVRGRYDYRVEFGPLLFLTAGHAEQEALVNNPAHFLPAIGGDCVATLVDDGQRVRGSIFHAAEYQGRLFLFADARRKSAFKAEPSRYALIDVAAGGACVVSQRDEQRVVAGDAHFAAWHHGLVYWFAGADALQKFLADPTRYEVQPPQLLREPASGEVPTDNANDAGSPQSAVAQ